MPYEKVGNEVKCIAEEVPFDIPDSWEIIRLNDIGIYKKGPFGSSLTKSMFVSKSDSSIKVYEQKNAIQKDATLGNYYITKKYYEEKMSGFTVNSSDIIVSCAGTIGETYVMPDNIELGIINQALMKMEIFAPINIDYFLLYFDYVLKQSAKDSSKGSAIKNIPPFDIFKKLLLPLPPLSEQQRIVNKLKELEPYINDYDKAYEKIEKLNNNFPEQLKKSILQEAVQGKLVPQNPNDEPASVLIERIRKEKQKLIQEKKIKKDKNESYIFRRDNSHYEKIGNEERCIDDEIPFDIPDSWEWVRLGNISNYGSCINIESIDIPDKMWILDLEDIEKDTGRLLTKKTKKEVKTLSTKHRFYNRQILYSKLRPYLNKVIIADEDGCCTSEILPITFYGNIYPEYTQIFLMSPYFVSYANQCSYGVKMPRLGTEDGKNAFFALPPLSEQKRIVEKIQTLMPIIEIL